MQIPQPQPADYGQDPAEWQGVVSRNATQGGNFARENGVEVLATELKTVLDDPAFQLMVI